MIIEQHYDEEVLAEFLAEPADAVTRDKHLASCALCLGTLDSLRASAGILAEPAVWDPTPVSAAPRPDTLAFLRNVQQTMKDEDATAAVWVRQLIAGPRETWAPRLEEHPEWRTAGMVRALMRAGDGALARVPADSVALTSLAVEIADRLAASNASKSVVQLQALAHYDHAYALYYTGAISQALEALDRADRCLAGVPSADFDRARVGVMRGLIYQFLERREDALKTTGEAAAVFARYEDNDRFVAARTNVAATLHSAQRVRDAIAIHAEIVDMPGISERWRLSAIHNLALCYRDIAEFAKAADCLIRAATGYEKLGMLTFRAKSRWVLAQVFALQGQHEQALVLFSELRNEFGELEMSNDVAMLSLDMCESLLALDRVAEIPSLCQGAIAYFASAGLAHTEPALRGLAYLREVAAAGTLTTAAIREVRSFLIAPSKQTQLLFAELQ